jgi:glucosyl-3-phosphoglycerate phosphatase
VTRLVIWRHGRTAWNAEGRVQGQLDVPMDEFGRVQAVLAAAQLARRRPDLIVSSDLRRASETAAELALITGQDVILDRRLRERAYGEWQGLTLEEIAAGWPAAAVRWRAGEPVNEAGVESIDEVTKRVADVLHEVVERVPEGVVVVSTHGGAARRGVSALLGWPDELLRTLGVLANCHWSELRYDGVRGWRLFSHNVGPDAEPVVPT